MSMAPNLARHAEIRNHLRDMGTSLAEIARELGVARATVTIVSQGYRRSHWVQAAIAAKLGVEPKDLFPERYPEGGGITG